MLRTAMACIAVLLSCGACGPASTPAESTSPSSVSPSVTSSTLQIAFQWSSIAVGETSRARASASADVTNLTTWRSSNPAVAAIDASGLITALQRGSTDVQAQYQGASTSARFTVYDGTDVVQVSVAIKSELVVGDSSQAGLNVSLRDGSGLSRSSFGLATFASSNPAVVAMSSDGTWTALSAGIADITGTYFGKTGTQRVTVSAVQDALAFAAGGASGNLQPGGVVTISTVLQYTLLSASSAQISVHQFDQNSRPVGSGPSVTVTSGTAQRVQIQETFTIPSSTTVLCSSALMQMSNGKSISTVSSGCLFINR